VLFLISLVHLPRHRNIHIHITQMNAASASSTSTPPPPPAAVQPRVMPLFNGMTMQQVDASLFGLQSLNSSLLVLGRGEVHPSSGSAHIATDTLILDRMSCRACTLRDLWPSVWCDGEPSSISMAINRRQTTAICRSKWPARSSLLHRLRTESYFVLLALTLRCTSRFLRLVFVRTTPTMQRPCNWKIRQQRQRQRQQSTMQPTQVQ
jgi:hypothetical protein